MAYDEELAERDEREQVLAEPHVEPWRERRQNASGRLRLDRREGQSMLSGTSWICWSRIV